MELLPRIRFREISLNARTARLFSLNVLVALPSLLQTHYFHEASRNRVSQANMQSLTRSNAATSSQLIDLANEASLEERISLLEAELQKKEQTRQKKPTATQRIEEIEKRLHRLESAMGHMQESFGDFIAALQEEDDTMQHEQDDDDFN